ncbi:hypothetical protein [Hyphomicrobium sp. D-2]|uniref:hypothetical protein n=1 Tax=Hyphomicrobium sp. D-2 TaxID=3041621 RepID=UPI0024573B57|nr:hypothetical protein [Hyphomicrobium sp. D-2]MDH4982095.1 hypothetical protein [Hyphomicrobium sp. D-2]
MGMKSLMSAAHAAGYAMAAEDMATDDLNRTQAKVARVPSTALVVVPTTQRSLLASTQRSLRRLWLRALTVEFVGHRGAAA